MTPQEIWWKTYWAALSGLCANPNGCPSPVIDMAEMIADETTHAFVASDGSVYNPRPSDYGVGK
jgi:hypothetical protein